MLQTAITLNSPIQEGLLGAIRSAIRRSVLFLAYSSGNTAGRENRLLETRFNEIVRRHDRLITRLCFGYARSSDELEDLRQDTLINIWQSLPKFRGEAAESTWIYRITLNTCVSVLRKRMPETTSLDSGILYDVIDEDDERKEQLAALHESISHLGGVDKALILMWLDGFTYEQMAEMAGLTRNTVATRLKRAKDKLARKTEQL